MIQGIMPNKRGDVEEEGKVAFAAASYKIYGDQAMGSALMDRMKR